MSAAHIDSRMMFLRDWRRGEARPVLQPVVLQRAVCAVARRAALSLPARRCYVPKPCGSRCKAGVSDKRKRNAW